MEHKKGCPRHGTEYLERKDGACYCRYPTPNETSKICFYHPEIGKTRVNKEGELKFYSTDPDPNYQPDVLKAIWESWGKTKYITRQKELM